jgi:hypothetical protein
MKLDCQDNHHKERMTVLIGLIGLKQSGKDTFADYLVDKHHFQKLAFAEPVKKLCHTMFLLSEEQLNDPVLKEQVDPRWGLSPRQMMQKVGTDMVRQMWDDDFWVKHMDMRLRKIVDKVVVSDVRFPNEAQWIRDKGGLLVRIDDGREQSSDAHSSETSQSAIQEDVCIFNEKNGLKDFHDKIENLFKKMKSINNVQ